MSDMDVLNRTIREQAKAEGKAEGRAEGKAEGRAEGRAEGKAEGKAAGRATALLGQLVARFGAVPPDLEARVCAADEATLATWSIRILTAGTREDVFADV